MLDDDHRKLWIAAQSFRDAAQARNFPHAMALFERLTTAVQMHFLREELLLAAEKAPYLDQHRAEHHGILRQFMIISGDGFRFLRSWPGLAGDLACRLLRHSLDHDMVAPDGFAALEPLWPLTPPDAERSHHS